MSPIRKTLDEQIEDDFFLPPADGETEDDLATKVLLSASPVIWGTDWTAATIVDQLRRGTIQLDPSFQRREAWTNQRKSQFIESLVLGLPVPEIVLAEHESTKGRFIVIDGKQRLLTLARFAGISMHDGGKPLAISGLRIRADLNRSTYRQWQHRNDDTLAAFENQAIRTVVIRSWKHEELLYAIFHRLNSGSVPLSAQELRQALHPGAFVTFASEYSEGSNGLRQILKLSRPDFRMRDVELLIRFYAFYNYLNLYNGNLKVFLDETCEKLNRFWATHDIELMKQAEEFELGVAAAAAIFKPAHVYRRWDGRRFERSLNRALFDVITISFAKPEIREACIQKSDEVLANFKLLCVDEEFRRSVETTTKSREAVSTRFVKWYRMIRKTTGLEVYPNLWA